LEKDESFSVNSRTAEIFIVIEGNVRFGVGDDKLRLASGESAFVVAGQQVNVRAAGKTLIYRASVPVDGK